LGLQFCSDGFGQATQDPIEGLEKREADSPKKPGGQKKEDVGKRKYY